MTGSEALTATVRIAAPPAAVFPYFVDPALLIQWLGQRADLHPEPGGRFDLDLGGTPVRGRYVEIDPPRRVVFTWGVTGREWMPPGSTTVEVVLTADGTDTIVELFHHDLPARERDSHRGGWTAMLGRLVPLFDVSALPLCAAEDLTVTVHWERDGTGLRGQIIARNAGARACRLAGKPTIEPLGLDGVPLPAETIVTLEARVPSYEVLRPGQRAAAPVTWREWCGPPVSERARITWDSGSAVAEVSGPAQPECSRGKSGDLSSTWFRLIE